ncbi:hypothetical protein ABPG74_006638 [Tetrahymena malaccensis]
MNKSIFIFAFLAAAIFGSAFYLAFKKQHIAIDESVTRIWNQWKQKHNKKYYNTDFELYRLEVFAQNLEIVKNDSTGTYGLTKFLDLTDEEFAGSFLNSSSDYPGDSIAEDIEVDPTININWVEAGKVSNVKSQGNCGSCWAFSAAASVESALIIAGKVDKSISLSEQQLIDCSGDYGNYGCAAGQKEQALVYIQRHSITTEQNYPYTEKDTQKCYFDKTKHIPNFAISSIKVLKASTNDLVEALKIQPVAVSVDATNWKYYKGGVFSDCKTYYHNHAVLLVGFQNGTWLIKNSYGTNWGENGYIRLKNGNTCGVANQPYQPVV